MSSSPLPNSGGRSRFPGTALAAVFLSLCLLGVVPAPAQPADTEPASERLLVGLMLQGREIGSLEVLRRPDGFLLPLHEFARLAELPLHAMTLKTPLGAARVDVNRVVVRQGVLYVHDADLARLLAGRVEFLPAEHALRVEVPWLEERSRSPRRREQPEAEIRAPRSNFSGLQGTLTHYTSGEVSELSGDLRAQGRFQRGLWSLQARDSTLESLELREAIWTGRHRRLTYQLGKQALGLHPSLAPFDLAGAQVGWTNRDLLSTGHPDGANVLNPRRVRPSETFVGQAPKGSFVQLRIDGNVVASRQVGYDGRYTFTDIPLPSRQITEIELLIFEPHNLQIPVEIRRTRLASSDLLLPRGLVTHAAGLGLTGQFTEGLVGGGGAVPNGAGGFYQWRQGLSRAVTGEGSVQHAAGQTQLSLGLVSRLGRDWILGTGLSGTSGALGHELSLEGFGKRWRLYGQSRSTPAAFSLVPGAGVDRNDHLVEFRYETPIRLRVGAVARARDDGEQRYRFLLPSVGWAPGPGIYLEVRPDSRGELLANGFWRVTDATRMRYFAADTSSFEISHDLTSRYQMAIHRSFGGGTAERYTLSMSRLPARAGGWGMSAGLVHTDEQLGYFVSGNTPVFPGVYLRAEYQSLPYILFDGTSAPGRLTLSLSTDLSQAGGRLVPADRVAPRRDRGSVAGKIRTTTPYDTADSLAGVAILVDGRVRARTDRGGRFFAGELTEGVHTIELDPERLPIELQPLRRSVAVEVASGAVTRVDFDVQPQYGLAGRIRDAEGRAAPGIAVVLRDGSGREIAQAASDPFGLYRLDGVPQGRYRLEPGGREVEIVDDFLFDVDIELP